MQTDYITWTDGLLDNFALPMVDSTKDATTYLQKQKADFIWHTLYNFEKIDASFQQTKNIINGRKVKGVQYGDLLKIKEYAKGLDFIISLVDSNVFALSKHILCCIHSCIASQEVSREQLGKFRTWDVKLNQVKYRPPHPNLLDAIWQNFLEFSQLKNPLEQGIITFLNLARVQFFYDNNKRTAMLYANAFLMSKNIRPFYIPAKDNEEFIANLVDFYDTCLADKIILQLASYAVEDQN